MKNLAIWEVSLRNFTITGQDSCVCYGHDEVGSSGDLYICTRDLYVADYGEKNRIKWTKALNDFTSGENNRPINATFLTLTNTLCVGLENGQLFTLSDQGATCDLAGVCDNGLLAMEWSPEQELLVLVTKDIKAILMTCTFDPINEVDLRSDEFGEKQFITVGWGKKETQFHGSEGKQAAKVKVEVSPDPNKQTDSSVKISWRGDGQLYAVGFSNDGIRQFKVFDREGQLQYTSEKQPGLESNLSWRPSGNVIATTQRLQDKYIVAFFEKNGLKHGGFTIPVNVNTQVEDLAWSSDSEILALLCKDLEKKSHKILLFTSGNYHWYLKQTLEYNSDEKVLKIMWDNDFDICNNKKLHVVFCHGKHLSFSFVWNIDHSEGKVDSDDAVVTVIDGKKVLITGFRQNVVPPPMAAVEIECETYVNSIHFAPPALDDKHIDSNTFFVCTSDNKIIFYEQTQKLPLKYKQLNTLEIDEYEFPFEYYYNWHWWKPDVIMSVLLDKTSCYVLVEWYFDGKKITRNNITRLPDAPMRMQSHPTDSSILFLHLKNGDIIEYKEGNIDIREVSFTVACPQFSVLSIQDNLYFLGLSHKGHLYLNEAVILNNVSSFFVHTHFLLITTLQHVLLCTELTKSGMSAIGEYQKIESDHVYKRKIERGAKLVIAVPNDTRTIFQMPRGNLEYIQPRPVSLKIIGKYLDQLKYYEAFDLMRKQRINLNLIYDHDPEKFVKYVDTFLDSIKNNSWLSLFLSELENVDVTKTMYASSYADKMVKLQNGNGDKIQKVCDIIRVNLLKRSDNDSKILPLITTFVKKNTDEDLEAALGVIKQLKLQESGGSKLPVGSDEALKYLLYMVDVNQLFHVALGMYDFDLVLLVANKSQKDPKEYIPMLNELNEMEENYKKFAINKHLKRFSRAVEFLVKCGLEKYGELKTFVKYHSLYRDALALFTPEEDIYKQISDDFGLYLKLKKQYIQAGIIYERASNIEKAIECYKEALEWELVIKLGHSLPFDQYKELCFDLVHALKDEKRYHEALKILELCCDDIQDTILFAIGSSQYKTAMRLCSQYGREDLKSERLYPAVLEEYRNFSDLVQSNWDTFIRYRERLFVVRKNKRKNPVEHYDPAYDNKDSDLYSDAGSTVASSRGSSRSYRSSKNRRKHERKVASLKEGSQYEDVALVMALHNLVTSSFELRSIVKEVDTALCCFNKDKEAFILQTSLEKLLKEMKDSFKDIWNNELVLEATNAAIAAQNVPEGVQVILQGIASLEPHIRIAPVIQDFSWKLEGLN